MEEGHIDIHSGGWDLRFPHHENEVAQAEAYFNFSQWINYWIHSGHLHIEGKKMSKSEKNFFTIREVLEKYSAQQLRIFFLRYKYNAQMDYSVAGLAGAVEVERRLNEFFSNVKAVLRKNPVSGPAKWARAGKDGDADDDVSEHKLAAIISHTKASVRVALADDFDTPQAMRHLQDLVKATNKYIQAKDEASEAPVPYILRSSASYVSKTLRMFGLTTEDPLAFGSAQAGGSASREEALAPVLDAFASFRDTIRSAARDGDPTKLMRACDDVRDNALKNVGVRLEDGKEGRGSTWKLMSEEDRAAESKAEADAKAKSDEKAARAARSRANAEKRDAERAAAAKMRPEDMFKGDDSYSKFDEQGIPTHDKEGNELTKNARKKLVKAFTKQKAKYEKANKAT